MQRKDAYLEIGLHWREESPRRGAGVFAVNLDFDDPEDTGDRRDFGEKQISIDTTALAQLVTNEAEYGKILSAWLFESAKVREFFTRAKTAGERDGIPVHLRLFVDPSAPRPFHAVRWESLRDPEDESRVAVKRNILFSRFLTSAAWKTISPPPKHDLRALVVIANPWNIENRGLEDEPPLQPFNVKGERERARVALADLEVTELISDGKPTLERVLKALDEGVDVLYLVCHGLVAGSEPVIYLESSDGKARAINGGDLATHVAGLTRRPTLAVLCSCASAGTGDEDLLEDGTALAALGPRLAEAGVPAVVAMQGSITMASAAAFMPAFFAALAEDGVVDRAVAVAREQISTRHDWWVPVLFSRLKRGRTYYLPEFGTKGADTWRALIDRIKRGRCTPVIGPGLADGLVGSRREIARSWAERWQMPVAEGNRGDLATVAQYLRVRSAPDQPAEELRSYLTSLYRDKYEDELPAELFEADDAEALVREVGRRLRERDSLEPDPLEPDPLEPCRVAASLRARVYVTTNWTTLLEDALEAAERPATTRYFDWASLRDQPDEAGEIKPDRDRPLVYHLFGSIAEPDSLVLSEDDYFAWLAAWIAKRDTEVIPPPVKIALSRRALLFLGYELDDWEFRALFQGIKSFGASHRMGDRPHVGVQLNPELQAIEPESAQEYLESYFGGDNVTIYWGRLSDFLKELDQRLRASR